MTDRIDHRAEALTHLALAGQVLGHEGRLEHLGYAQAHALLAIADALTDRYAANEARQREEAAEPDPLTFAPDASPAPQGAAQDAAEGDGDAVEGGGSAGPSETLLCPECGHDIEAHLVIGCFHLATGVCSCLRSPSDIARHLIEQATSGADAGAPKQSSALLHLAILRDTVADWREMSTPSVSTRGWQRGWRAGVDLCTAILAEIADEYEKEAVAKAPEAGATS